MAARYYLGLDMGTQSLKALLVDESFQVCGTGRIAWGTEFPKPGHAEQDPARWRAALLPAIAQACGQARCGPEAIVSLGITGQLDGCIPVNRHNTPLGPAMIWMDRRAEPEISDIPADVIRARCGLVADASHLAAKARWWKRHGTAPAHLFHGPVSWMVAELTGVDVIDPATASTSMVYDLAACDYADDLLARFDLTRAELPPCLAAHTLAGALSEKGAHLCGLRAGILVAVGSGDDFATALGASLMPNRLLVSLGTAEIVGARFAEGLIDQHGLVETHAYPAGGFYIENPGWLSGGALTWFCTTFGVDGPQVLDRLAAEIPAGAEGALFIPALTGAMTPEWIAGARGTFFGLTPRHGTAHLARAMLEGLTFAMRDVLERLQAMGGNISALRLVGGGARSPLWAQMRADCSGLPVEIPHHVDTAALGGALLGAVAGAFAENLDSAGALLSQSLPPVLPNAAMKPVYDAAWGRYRDLFAALKPINKAATAPPQVSQAAPLAPLVAP